MGSIFRRGKLSRAEVLIVVLFILSLPFVGSKIDWDGTLYYGYLRSVMFDHNLQFQGDWIAVPGRHSLPITKTGHPANYLAVGPAILWAPFVAATRLAIAVRHVGESNPIPDDGRGPPYVHAVCFASALYAFLGLWISFRLARDFVEEKWALLATVGIWFASSLTLYMYADPSWAHADCVFVVALFLWYWQRTRAGRTGKQWWWWGLIAGLMCDVYFPNSVFLLLPTLELILELRTRQDRIGAMRDNFLRGLAFAAAFVLAFLPTMIAREIIFGNPLSTGAYGSQRWNWASPHFGGVLFASSHGAFTTTPILLIASAGLFLLWWEQPSLGGRFVLLALGFWCLIALYPWWDGHTSYGCRFFVSLTPIFITGLAVAFEGFAAMLKDSRAALRLAVAVSALLIIWNMGLVFQLDHGLFMQVGPVDWHNAEFNQFRRVPGMVALDISAKLSHRTELREQARSN